MHYFDSTPFPTEKKIRPFYVPRSLIPFFMGFFCFFFFFLMAKDAMIRVGINHKAMNTECPPDFIQ
jgi:hypothetical protein